MTKWQAYRFNNFFGKKFIAEKLR